VLSSLEPTLAQKRIVVCVGPGGVGKTTTAAAAALAAAQAGRKTLVITIDPARRLANSLGLTDLGHEVQQVNPALFASGARQPGGELHAMMLDQKAAFDEVVARHAAHPAAVERILANPLYAQISSALSGAHEYAAMAKLQEFHGSGRWDLIIVDTPPTDHALDFLDAPQKLSEAIDSPAVEWFRKLSSGRGGWSLLGRTGSFVLRRLAKFVGSKFLDDVGAFFTEFNDVLGGFRARAEETFALLRQSSVGFVVIASPEPMATREALYFHGRLAASSMNFSGFVVNKLVRSRPTSLTVAQTEQQLAAYPAVAALGLSRTSMRMTAEALHQAHHDMELKALADERSLIKLRQAAGGSALIEIPLQDQDVHEISRLQAIAQRLIAG
jgi:anion-transporting  ArsA/GET3 family ATPase